MSRVFDAYARYYDQLYRDKDYAAEAEYIASHIRKQAPNAKRILELGCGTGAHAEHLARMGYTAHGVDLGEAMFARAEARKASMPPEVAARLSFGLGDVRTVRTGQTYDAVVSLFHVMSYQTTNQDILNAFLSARKHLNPGAMFIFDCWYGPAVLSQGPAVRVKVLEDHETEIIRIAEPTIHANENIVDVNYKILAINKVTRTSEELHECHRMRYLFKPEIEEMLNRAGLHLEQVMEYMTLRPPVIGSWSACFVARRLAAQTNDSSNR